MRWRDLAGTWVALVALLAITAGMAYLPLGSGNVAVSVGIGGVKAVLIALLFMNLRSAPGLLRLAAVTGLFWLTILFSLTFSDFLTRP